MKHSVRPGTQSRKSSSSSSSRIVSTVEYTHGRLPQAPASLLVQLPPDELKKLQDASQFDDLSSSSRRGVTATSSSVQASDVHLLASSIHERRVREARIFTWQQRLIDADAKLSREELKRALTQLSVSSWLQVLQERHLDGRCAYPSCLRRSKQPHLSARKTVLPPDAPRYRISIAKRTVRRDERDDAGGENGYCSKACWRRGEWVSRWVLEGGATSRYESKKNKQRKEKGFGSVLSDSTIGLGDEVDDGGRWERLIEEDQWESIELLEDLEDAGEVDRLSDDESHQRAVELCSPPINEPEATAALDSKEANTGLGPTHKIQSELNDFSSMLGSLEIVERPSHSLVEQIAPKPPSPSADPPRRPPRFTQKDGQTDRKLDIANESLVDFEDDDSDGDDILGELSIRSAVEGEGDVVSSILQTSRNLQKQSIEEEEHDAKPLSEEEILRFKEEDDLFARAWQARDEEIAKGTWVE